jgi:hypothetical protein
LRVPSSWSTGPSVDEHGPNPNVSIADDQGLNEGILYVNGEGSHVPDTSDSPTTKGNAAFNRRDSDDDVDPGATASTQEAGELKHRLTFTTVSFF